MNAAEGLSYISQTVISVSCQRNYVGVMFVSS